LKRKHSFIGILLIALIIFVAGNHFLKKSEETTAKEENAQETRKSVGETKLVVSHSKGNVLLKEWDENYLKVDQENRKKEKTNIDIKTELKNDTAHFLIEEGLEEPIDLTFWLPKKFTSLDVLAKDGNIKGELLTNKEFVRFVSNEGHIISEYQEINPTSKNIMTTQNGAVLIQVPKSTEVKVAGKATYNGVGESNNGTEFIVSANSTPIFLTSDYKVETLDKDKVLTVEDMKSDVDALVEALDLYHPNYNNPTVELSQRIDEVYEAITQPQTVEKFYILINSILVQTKDAHTVLEYYQPDYVPFPFVMWTNEGVISLNENEFFNKGDIIETVNGKPMDEILKLLMNLIPAEYDGWVKLNTGKALSNGVFLRELGLVNDQNRVPVLIDRDGEKYVVELELKEAETGNNHLFEEEVEPFYSWELHPDENYAIFNIDRSILTQDYDKEVITFFDEAEQQGIENIVLDISRNSGGSSLVVDPFVRELKNRSYSKDHVFVLTFYQTFSAGVDFAISLKSTGLATVVGMETGNIVGYLGNNTPFQLPVTGWSGQMPTSKNMGTGGFDVTKPLIPDYYIEFTRDKIINLEPIEVWLEVVKELIK
jgi:hypothetical protein